EEKEKGERRKEEGGRRKEEGGRRKDESENVRVSAFIPPLSLFRQSKSFEPVRTTHGKGSPF
ncbi:MAG: hypothetical protein ABR915_20240, partial [Thermoguttaceae bacterium]